MGIIILLIILLIIVPELFILVGVFLLGILYGIGEFILRLFGKSFENNENDKK